jgi:hypothetical protein
MNPECRNSLSPKAPGRWWGVLCLLAMVGLFLTGCGKSAVDEALDSDANGYVCLACKAMFYTDRTVFATRCPECKKPDIEQAIGYVCAADQRVTIGPRGRRSVACKTCGAATTSMSIPREADFKEWGATHKSESDVTGN